MPGSPPLDLSNVTLAPLPDPVTVGGTPTPDPDPPTPAPSPTPTPEPIVLRPRDGSLYADRMGINFISSAQHETDEARFWAGLDAGAGWDRFAIYWYDIETEPDQYDWDLYDETVRNDVIYGLDTDAILLGAPLFYQAPNLIPNNLFEPVFADGTDNPGPGKALNPGNPWAEWVYATVSRYMPGGELAQLEGWPEGTGIRAWEIWNEPDFTMFWQGNVEEYARLLKVAYLAALSADPQAQVAVGGMVLFEQPEFFSRLLEIYQNDAAPVDRRYPFTVVAVHSYSHPPYTFHIVQRTETLLAVHGLSDVPIWLNESGIAAWDDYPGPAWATRPDQRVWRATQTEQAAYVIQNAAFALLSGADKLFHFQLYDDCGNQPRGTTFAPHDGSLCDTGAVCFGDALGLLRNTSDNVCFNQHPEPGTARPAYDAYRLVAEVLGDGDVVPLTGYIQDGRWRVIFARPETGETITLVWDETGQAGGMLLPARGSEATLIHMDGTREAITPGGDGNYLIMLEPATNQAQADGSAFAYMVGGPPVIVIEQHSRPVVSVLPLLDASRTAALVKWESNDPSVTFYEVYYRDDTSGENEWVLWIQTDQPGEEIFAAGIGRSYSFYARGLTAAGWTSEFPIAQAWTRLE